MRRWWLTACALSVVVACAGAPDRAGPSASDGVRIASFDFDESRVLAELYAQSIEAAGVPVVRLGPVGPREVVAPALEQGLIDLVPEYLGTAANHFGADRADRAGLVAALRPRHLAALREAPAQDVNVLVVGWETAAERDLTTITDLATVAGTLRIGGPVECAERPLCLVGLRDVYGAEFAEFVPQRSLAVTAEALARGEIDVGVMFSTAPEVTAGPFLVLADDRHLQPTDNVVPVVRTAALARWGHAVADALDRVSAVLTTDVLRALNRRVAEGASPRTAVAGWLDSEGLRG